MNHLGGHLMIAAEHRARITRAQRYGSLHSNGPARTRRAAADRPWRLLRRPAPGVVIASTS